MTDQTDDEPQPTETPAASAPSAGGRFGARIRKSGYLQRWLLLGVTIGLVAGLGAVVFYLALRYTGEFLLGYLGGYHIPTPVGEGGARGDSGFRRAWAIPLVTTGGALLSAFIVAKLAPEATGHGTDQAIEAVHGDPRAIRFRAVLVKMVASALTIGSGGSAGREGPTAQISAGFSSLLARRLHLSDEDGRIAVALGIGAGIGAIFAAPLGGAVLAASITYRDDFDYRCLLPGFITSGTAYAVLGAFLGFDPLFGYIDAEYRFERAWPLLWFVVIGLAAFAVGYLYARTFHAAVRLTRRLPGGPVLKPAIGGLLVGLLGLLIPQILSSGYGWAQLAADRGSLLGIPLWVVVVLPIAKIVATSLSIGTGGSGGLFGPGIVIGAFVGAAVWRLGELSGLPGVPHDPGIFVVVGMMTCFGSVARAPLAIMIMVAEMTGSFSVVPGAILSAGIAALLMSRTNVTIYESQRLNRETAAAERERRVKDDH
ncbi:chloride channel protein [Mycobacterium nebraskense]|uniref:Chloride channel protein n=1 Tax=Mycobacterium nebraskense TaxID=244292 RepID=A0A0F5NA83_9MYCO|nr:chloride channel protein [Mycobacterium nebraskense]KKC03984.1 chloride channel protein [Mycobacterium nebraskense]KLO44153.1 chloride channel protein [Mycobacterium nebraskense]MBI2696270.1 chloride channel protein [Mycobacterium nebraskense]MCV7119687.1 chloride channel protein [Mycobacterium nebraskense]ORW28422.1 chloride channel protein [Mycobacterium nebraskense]